MKADRDTQQTSAAKPKTKWERMKKTELDLERLIDLLEHAKLAEGKSKRIGQWYRDNIGFYIRWLETQGLERTLGNFSLELVRRYVIDLYKQEAYACKPAMNKTGRHLSDQTINTYVRALRGFSNWLCSEHYTVEPMLAGLRMPKVSKKIQDILTPEEIVGIVNSLNPRTEIGARNQAIFLLLIDTGMRAGELSGLSLSALHLDEGYATVMGKGKRERPVKIGSRAAKAVRFYLLHWRKPSIASEDHVFLTCRTIVREDMVFAPEAGSPLTVNALGHILKRVGRAADVPRLHPHLLRHTFACMYLMRHRDPFALKSLLGHSTLAMTNHYCEAVRQMDVVRADSVSIIDGLDLRALDVNRRGRPAKAVK